MGKAQKGGGGKPTDACKKELAACNKNKVCAALHKKLAKAMADSKKGQQGKPQDKKKDTDKKKPDKKQKPDKQGPDNKDKKKKQQQQGPNKKNKKGKNNRQLFADTKKVKKNQFQGKSDKKPQPKKDGNNKNKNDNAKPKPQPKKDGNKELDALKKACQKNALCKKLMECKAKAQKGGGGKPTDACKKE